MLLDFGCPSCLVASRQELAPSSTQVVCPHCSWTRPIPPADYPAGRPRKCLACGCDDVWRQKDFPPFVGVAIVTLAAVISSVMYAYYLPEWAIGVLMLAAVVDMALFALMPDRLVCYRCGAVYRSVEIDPAQPVFDLEKAERYRQEKIRLAQAAPPSK